MGAVAAFVVAGWVIYVRSLEQPDYRVDIQDGAIEVRAYPELIVAEVARPGDRKAAVSAGFRPLAAYIFDEERAGGPIAMTAPVTQQRAEIAMTAPVTQQRVEDAWVVRFHMPAAYTLETLPKPANAEVRLTAVPATRRAAIRFSGVATDALIAEHEAALRAWLSGRGLRPAGAATYAYYNDPWTPGPLRRNEVMFDLAGPGGG